MSDSLPGSIRPPFRALAAVFVPETAQADESSWLRLEQIVAGALAAQPPRRQRQILLFIRVLDGIALLRHGRRLSALDDSSRRNLVEGIARSRVLLIRRGVWGLRTLVQMGWYAQPEIQRSLGYRAQAAGWEARR